MTFVKIESKNILKFVCMFTVAFGGLVYADTIPANPPTDSQIIKIVIAANHEEIDTSQLLKKSNNRALKALANRMVKDHTQSIAEMKKLAKNIGLAPEQSKASEDIKKDAAAKVTELEKLNGAKFDKVYINSLVGDHEALLKTFDTTLIPSSKNAQLTALLKKTKAVVQDHLTMAKQIQPTIDE